MLRGSHARRAATAHSDVDVDVLLAGAPYAARQAFLAEHGGRLTHVSVAARDVRSWLARLGEPADWAFGLPVAAPARLLWADPHWRPRIDLPVLCQPAGEPQLEELIATLGKVAGARDADDHLGVRLAAADLARLCPSVLRLANPTVRVASRRGAFAAALDLPVAPPNYRDDLLLCLGLRPGSVGQLCAAAARLVAGVLPLIRPYAAEVARVAGADLAAALTDGRLDRYVDQLTRPAHLPPRPRREPSPVPAPRAGQLVTVPVPDAPVTGAHPSPQEPAADGTARSSRLDPAIAARLRRTPDGLVAAVVRQHDSGEVLMVAWMDDEALHRTLTTGRATYWSRSRREYWVKGATSGHHQYVRAVALDCDGDALLVDVDQVGAACHTGHRTCFFTELPVGGEGAGAR
ncbi:phosphoribosyl-AMP cyclohydrolase [Micromonospora echinofusca]|uniref:Phosphoribosyl-AMP cyclohydrolase n=1 Tax=Micromonospora echinofusca TaxID=47858 RepID=A0A1C5G685_MICEH|nr:phosphoribosyl-AMP cyclohydrolase [Micromonospora echinofusca]